MRSGEGKGHQSMININFNLSLKYLRQQVHQRQGHCEGAKEYVRYCEVGDEDVPGGEHHLVGEEGEEDGDVAHDAEYYNQTVEDNQRVVDEGVQPDRKNSNFRKQIKPASFFKDLLTS